jgi:hypothetical protein
LLENSGTLVAGIVLWDGWYSAMNFDRCFKDFLWKKHDWFGTPGFTLLHSKASGMELLRLRGGSHG